MRCPAKIIADTIFIESGFIINDLSLPPNQADELLHLINGGKSEHYFEDEALFTIWQHEQIEEGLPEYF